jgi:hypothetical protein
LCGGVFANTMGDAICIINLVVGIIVQILWRPFYRNEHNVFRIFIKIDLNQSKKWFLSLLNNFNKNNKNIK